MSSEGYTVGLVGPAGPPGLIQSGQDEVTVDASNVALGVFQYILRDGVAPLEVTLVCQAGSFLIAWFTASPTNAAATSNDLYHFVLDGAGVPRSDRVARIWVPGVPDTVALCSRVGPVAAGPHSMRVGWQNNAGLGGACLLRSASQAPYEQAQLILAEVAA